MHRRACRRIGLSPLNRILARSPEQRATHPPLFHASPFLVSAPFRKRPRRQPSLGNSPQIPSLAPAKSRISTRYTMKVKNAASLLFPAASQKCLIQKQHVSFPVF
jgi:hypothetical protein